MLYPTSITSLNSSTMAKLVNYCPLIAVACLVAATAAYANALPTAATTSTASLLDTAGDLVARALSSSNVLTLNITNVVILVILKIIIFVGGLFVLNSSSSSYGIGGLFGRADDLDAAGGQSSGATAAITTTDLRGGMCFLLYTSGAEEKLGCMLEAACADPLAADRYLSAGKMWQQANQLLQS